MNGLSTSTSKLARRTPPCAPKGTSMSIPPEQKRGKAYSHDGVMKKTKSTILRSMKWEGPDPTTVTIILKTRFDPDLDFRAVQIAPRLTPAHPMAARRRGQHVVLLGCDAVEDALHLLHHRLLLFLLLPPHIDWADCLRPHTHRRRQGSELRCGGKFKLLILLILKLIYTSFSDVGNLLLALTVSVL